MATAAEHPASSMALECQVCNEQYDDSSHYPCVLACGHSFCMNCIQELIKAGHIRCPFDNRIHNYERVSDIPKNFALMDVINAFRGTDNHGNFDTLLGIEDNKELLSQPLQSETVVNEREHNKEPVFEVIEDTDKLEVENIQANLNELKVLAFEIIDAIDCVCTEDLSEISNVDCKKIVHFLRELKGKYQDNLSGKYIALFL